MPSSDAPSALPWYRHPHVWLLIAFPAVSVVGGIAMLIIALRTDDGLVADDYYRQGMEINRSLARDRQAEVAGLSATLDLDSAPGRVRVTLRADPGFRPPPHIRLSFLHPTRAGFDRIVELGTVAPMTYEGRAPELHPARWHALLEGNDWRLFETIDRR